MSAHHADLTFDSLPVLDDKLALLLKKHMSTVAQDCMNRPDDSTVRKVVVEFNFKPTMDSDRECDIVWLEVECKSKVPVYRSKPHPLRVHKTGFLFNKDFPDNLDQQPLFRDPDED